MKVRDCWSIFDGKVRFTDPTVKVSSAGYVPISKRIDMMVRAGVELQKKPIYYQFQDGKIPDKFTTVNPRGNDLVEQMSRAKDAVDGVSAVLAEQARSASVKASDEFKQRIIADYLSEQAKLAASPSPAPGGTVVGS